MQLRAGWIVLACSALVGSVFAQSSDAKVSITPRISTQLEARPSRSGVIRADANRVFISATVTDTYGRPVEGLRKQQFRLLEDGIEQDMSDFFIEDGPISIGVVLDVSASIRNKLSEAQRTISEFLGFSTAWRRVFPGDLQRPTRTCARVHDQAGRYRSRSCGGSAQRLDCDVRRNGFGDQPYEASEPEPPRSAGP